MRAGLGVSAACNSMARRARMRGIDFATQVADAAEQMIAVVDELAAHPKAGQGDGRFVEKDVFSRLSARLMAIARAVIGRIQRFTSIGHGFAANNRV